MTNYTLLQKARVFSRYAYVAQPSWEVLSLFNDDAFMARKREYAQRTPRELFAITDAAARVAFDDAFRDLPSEIAIPLSGGRDSRFILAMAVERGFASRITTLTWGVPGGLDFEIGRKVARHFGVRHLALNVLDHPLTFEHLRSAYAGGAQWTDLVFAHYNRAWRAMTPGAHAIIGYLGGPPVGCHYARGDENLDFAAAVAAFEKVNCRRQCGAPMIGDVRDRLIDPVRIALSEQLDIVYRQEGYLRRIVASFSPDVRTPFAHAEWLRTMYALPGHLREDSRFFSVYLQQRFPKAFSLGVARAYGGRTNASDWERRALRQIVRVSHAGLNALRERGFRTFDKYGDERDLCMLLARGAGPRAYERLVARRPPRLSRQDAHDWRQRAMLIANLSCAGLGRDLDAAQAA